MSYEKRAAGGTAPSKKFFYGYVVVAASFCVWVVSLGANQTFSVFFKPMTDEFGWGRAETVSAFSLMLVVQAVMGVFLGWLTDRLGPRLVVTVFGSFLGIAYLLMSRTTALWQFQLSYALVMGIGLSTATVPVMATVTRWFEKRRGLMIALVQAGIGIGGLIFAPFAGWLIINHGWRNAYMVLGIIVLTVIIISGLLLRRDPREIGQLPDGQTEEVKAEKKVGSDKKVAGFSLRKALRLRQFWMLIGIFFAFGFCRSTFLPHVAAHVQDLGFSLSDGANVVAALTVSSIMGRFGLGRLGNEAALALGFVITAAAMTWALITRDLWGLYLFGLLFGFGWGAQSVLRFTVAAEKVGLVSIGLVMGICGFIDLIAGAFGSFYAGYLYDVTGNYQPIFSIAIPISIAGAVIALLLRKVSGRMMPE